MRKKDIKTDYRCDKFCDKVPLISCKDQMKLYFDNKFGAIDIDIDTEEIKETIVNTIDSTLNSTLDSTLNSTLDSKLDKVHKHIEDAKEHLCCDVFCAKNDIKKHIDNKIDTINFEEQFSNLNEQVTEILNKLDNN